MVPIDENFQPVYMICVWMTIIILLEPQRSKGKVQEKVNLLKRFLVIV